MSDEVTIEGPLYAQLPEDLLYDPNISDGAVRVYGVLRRHGETPGRCFPSHERIAGFIGKQPRSINRLIVELEQAGWIVRQQRRVKGNYTTCAYIVRSVKPTAAQISATTGAHESAPTAAQISATTGAHESAPNESNMNESKLNETPLPPTPSLQLVPTPDRVDVDDLVGFPEFWDAYPKRNGKRLGRAKCQGMWRRLTLEERRAAWRGATHYADATTTGLTIAKDPERWLRDRLWDDWQEPAVADRPTRTGSPTRYRESLDELMRKVVE